MNILSKLTIPALCCMLLGGCDLIDYHPYDVRIDGETGINDKNIARIETLCQGKDTLRFAFMGDVFVIDTCFPVYAYVVGVVVNEVAPAKQHAAQGRDCQFAEYIHSLAFFGPLAKVGHSLGLSVSRFSFLEF